MAVATNEPYRRVSKDNGAFDGALIGAAVGAGGAGAGIFGARMSHNGIEKRAQREVARMDSSLNALANRESKAVENYNKKIDKIVDLERSSDPSTRSGRMGSRKTQKHNFNKVEKPLDKLEAKHQKNLNKIRTDVDRLANTFEEVSRPDYVSNKQAAHAYSKMGGGWRKAGIIGATAVVGGGIGMIADGIHK